LILSGSIARLPRPSRCLLCVAASLLAVASLSAQTPAPATPAPAAPVLPANGVIALQPEVRQPTHREERKAAKLFLKASELFRNQRYEEAMQLYKAAIQLDPLNKDYPLALEVARNHAVTALVQNAVLERNRGDAAAARAALAHARAIKPDSEQVAMHLNELGEDALAGSFQPPYAEAAASVGSAPELVHNNQLHSFHLNTSGRDLLQQVFKAWNIDVTLDQALTSNFVHFNMDDASFPEAVRAACQIAQAFYVVLDPHRVLVLRENHENHIRYDRMDMETIYFAGISKEELGDIGKLAKDLFNINESAIDNSENTLTLHANRADLNAFNETVRTLLAGRSQILLDVRVIQLAHVNSRNTGAQLPQTFTAYNLYTEEQSILNSNQSAVQEIISSGLASASDPLAIIAILVAAGDVSSSLFGNGLALFGGGITQSALAPGSDSLHLNVNTSNSRSLENVQLRLGDGEEGRVRLGERYPIQTSSYSSMYGSSSSALAGLTGSGNSSTLSSLLSSYASSYNVPMVEYQDIGLTIKATPKIMRSGDVALTLDTKIDALSGSTVNDVPILDSRVYSGVVTLKEGESVVVAQEIDKTISKALNGTPGLSEIPGLNYLTDVDKEQNYATLLMIMTPHLLRGPQPAGHTPMMRVVNQTQIR
jgi:Flp pilus assembly secretin CpaC